jgi:RNA recognition motif-containing protein
LPALFGAEFREYDATDARVMVDKVSGKSRGFGFVFFGDEKGLRSAIDALHGTDWDGRRISVTRAIPQSETAPGTPAAVLMAGRDSRGPRCELSGKNLVLALPSRS